ncbi:MAG: hypothetical protein BWX60_00537 [Candidatus Marinimicrobia bacterium ADurb.Bin030]|nr:MAG: hypothetical protein BWX60_00537 [Candidatus Marinimicrobia bacterium ADurb.Bin030]
MNIIEVLKLAQNLPTLDLCPSNTHQNRKFARFTRLEFKINLQNAYAVITNGNGIKTFALFHHNGIMVTAIATEEYFPVGIVTADFRTHDSHKSMFIAIVKPEIASIVRQIDVDPVVDDISDYIHPKNELSILQIKSILPYVPIIGVFNESKETQTSCNIITVVNFQ